MKLLPAYLTKQEHLGYNTADNNVNAESPVKATHYADASNAQGRKKKKQWPGVPHTLLFFQFVHPPATMVQEQLWAEWTESGCNLL